MPGQDNETCMELDSVATQQPANPQQDEDTDEYSDFPDDDEALEIIDRLLTQAANQHAQEQNATLRVTDIEDYEDPRGIRLPKVPGLDPTHQWNGQSAATQVQQVVREESAERGRRQGTEDDVKTEDQLESLPPEQTEQITTQKSLEPDTRSPLERFRKPPKKALSVTDLISPSWCELQYYYVLTKHGRKRRTPAMKQGSAVHQALEDEIHVTVPVEITKKEDSWGLRIWNIIQGLQTLRETGMTRELEIWGSVGGEIVNGVIDELSYECPDPGLEEAGQNAPGNKHVEPPIPEYQASIRDYLVTSEHRIQGQSLPEALTLSTSFGQGTRKSAQDNEKKIYITDVKTRQTPTLPTGSAILPTLVQLHLYHHMLENLAQGTFSLSQLSERYNFDINETFSDGFIAQIGGLGGEMDLKQYARLSEGGFNTAELEETDLPTSSEDPMDILLQHNSLASLWEYMMGQLRLTFIYPNSSTSTLHDEPSSSATGSSIPEDPTIPPPSSLSQLPQPPSHPTRLSPILTARYISTNYRHLGGNNNTSSNDGGEADEDPPQPRPSILGSKSILFNPSFLTSSLYASLGFWRGEREPQGVEINDAWKCRVCEFRDECTWVKERDEAVLKEVRERRRKLKENGGETTVGGESEINGRRSHV